MNSQRNHFHGDWQYIIALNLYAILATFIYCRHHTSSVHSVAIFSVPEPIGRNPLPRNIWPRHIQMGSNTRPNIRCKALSVE